MLLTVIVQPAGLFNNIHDLIRMAFPEYELREGKCERAAGYIDITLTQFEDYILVSGEIYLNEKKTVDQQIFEPDTGDLKPAPSIKYWVRRFTYQLICRHLDGDFNPYGILTGVRPLKIVHRWLDEGWDSQKIKKGLESKYLLNSHKANLLVEVARNNHPFLLSREEAHKQLGLYIGIPFCPSRCYYCSFPGAVLHDYQRDMVPYIKALLLEMSIIGDYIAASGWKVQTIYIGGGTPSVITDIDLERIFEVLNHKYISPATKEITIEAGRPDTLTPDRMHRVKNAGVNRICINPQTMNDDTLKLIGRSHDTRMIVEAVGWARSAGIEHINMDLIVGLPGEELDQYGDSVTQVLHLNPDNITVHTLAVKRGSPMAEAEGKANNQERTAAVEQGINYCDQLIKQAGYQPYYLYRQKYMKAALENTGYSQPGSACLYNIQMIEERQTIIGLGGGSSSKFVDPSDWTLTSIHNPKDPRTYVGVVEKLSARKVDKLRALH